MKKVSAILFMCLMICNLSAQYEKSIEVGGSLGVGEYKNNTFGLSMINGYRFSDYLYAGVGIGFGYSNTLTMVKKETLLTSYISIRESRNDAYLIPIYAHVKANLTQGKISPFFSLNIGYTIDANQYLKDAPGLMIQPNFGVDFKLSEKTAIYGLVGFNLQNTKYTYWYEGDSTSDFELTNKEELFKAIDIKVGFRF